jgi:hypothetical protein
MSSTTLAEAMSTREARFPSSQEKYVPPFEVDPSMCFYSPQENIDALTHPRVAQWLDFVTNDYVPVLPDCETVLLILPCTRIKPYPMSLEHRRVNAALNEAGFVSTGELSPPKGFPDPSMLLRSKGRSRRIAVHRMVVSEPLALVPYEFIYEWRGEVSPASSYDDPGLFEERGTSVSPWHPRHSATPDPKHVGRWRWGPNEKADYVTMHNAMSAAITTALERFGHLYTHRISWVAPGLTHRSFVSSFAQKRADGIPAARQVQGRRLDLVGVNDHSRFPIDVRPTAAELAAGAHRRVAHPILEPDLLDVLLKAIEAP